MIIYGVIGALVMALAYVVVRSQSTQSELRRLKFVLKSEQNRCKFSLDSIQLMAKVLKHSYKLKLEAIRRHGEIYGDDLMVIQFLIDNFDFVMKECCENNATVEEALVKSLEGMPFDMQKIKQCIGRQPNEVSVAWAKNTVDGFLSVCNNLTASKQKLAEHAPAGLRSEVVNQPA